jgi:hypothetical protein
MTYALRVRQLGRPGDELVAGFGAVSHGWRPWIWTAVSQTGGCGQRAGHEPTPLGGHADAATESQRGFADEGSAATLNVLLYLFSLVTKTTGDRHPAEERNRGSRNRAPPPGFHPGASSGPGRGYGFLHRGPARHRFWIRAGSRTAAQGGHRRAPAVADSADRRGSPARPLRPQASPRPFSRLPQAIRNRFVSSRRRPGCHPR